MTVADFSPPAASATTTSDPARRSGGAAAGAAAAPGASWASGSRQPEDLVVGRRDGRRAGPGAVERHEEEARPAARHGAAAPLAVQQDRAAREARPGPRVVGRGRGVRRRVVAAPAPARAQGLGRQRPRAGVVRRRGRVVRRQERPHAVAGDAALDAALVVRDVEAEGALGADFVPRARVRRGAGRDDVAPLVAAAAPEHLAAAAPAAVERDGDAAARGARGRAVPRRLGVGRRRVGGGRPARPRRVRRRRGGGPAPPEAPRVDAVEPRAVRGEEVHAAVGPNARHAVGRPGRAGVREAVHDVAHGEGSHRRRAALARGQPRARLCVASTGHRGSGRRHTVQTRQRVKGLEGLELG